MDNYFKPKDFYSITGFSSREDIVKIANEKSQLLLEIIQELKAGLEKISIESPENSNFSRSEDEAQYYIDTATETLQSVNAKLAELNREDKK